MRLNTPTEPPPTVNRNFLSEQGVTLWIALCRKMTELRQNDCCWKSRLHSDGSSFPNWFVLGIGYEPGYQITYHLPFYRWTECGFAKELERAPEFDGHTPADLLKRIAAL